MSATATVSQHSSATQHEQIERPSERSTCDGCGVRAYVWVKIATPNLSRRTMELTLCGHHYQKHESALLPLVIDMMDDRQTLISH